MKVVLLQHFKASTTGMEAEESLVKELFGDKELDPSNYRPL